MAEAPIPPTPPAPRAAPAGPPSSLRSLSEKLQAGETTIDDKLAFEVELASYQQLKRLTAIVKERLERHLATSDTTSSAVAPDSSGRGAGTSVDEPSQQAHLFFLDQALRSALDIAATIEVQLRNLKEAYAGARETAESALAELQAPTPTLERRRRSFRAMPGLESIAAASVAADAAVMLIGALKTDTRYFGRQVVIPEQAFALALAHQWSDDDAVQFHYPTLFVPPTPERKDLVQDVVKAFDAALEERKAASQALSSLLSRVAQLGASAPEFMLAKPSLDSARDQFEAAEGVFDRISTHFSQADERTGLTQLQLLERAAFVMAVGNSARRRTFYLFAQVVSAGGAFRTTRNFLRSLFTRDTLEHTGGCIVTFALFDDEGRLRASDTIGGRSEYEDSRPGTSF